MKRVTARVPATVANLGPGFDCLGMAVGLFTDVTLEIESGREGMSISGEGRDLLPTGRSNLVRRSLALVADTLGVPAPPIWIEMINRIPITGGLGGSAAAVVGGLLAANALWGEPLSRETLLELATEIEGHPDNVAPALEGGLIVAARDEGEVHHVRLATPAGLQTVVFVPYFAMPTSESRRLLPSSYHRNQAIFNVGRSSLLIAAMCSGRLDLLRVATQDQLHQPYREQMFPSMSRFFAAAQEAGALGCFLCGAGSALMAFCDCRQAEIQAAFSEVSRQEGIEGRVGSLPICDSGAFLLRPEAAEAEGEAPPLLTAVGGH